MKKPNNAFNRTVLAWLFVGFLGTGTALAKEGTARVFPLDPISTPQLKGVTLEDLDDSGYLKNSLLQLLILKNSPYDYPAYSPEGNFVYSPEFWDYTHINPEGIKFDQASTYYYLTTIRKYFEGKFGYKQSEVLHVKMFYPGLEIKDAYFHYDKNGAEILVTIPGDPNRKWAPNYYREYSSLMHEYSHFVFHRAMQDSKYIRPEYSEAAAIDEGIAIFWPSSIMDESRSGVSLYPPGITPPDLKFDAIYDPTLTNLEEKFGSMVGALTSALWDLREHPRIGKTNAEKLLWHAMSLIPHEGALLADVTDTIIRAKTNLPENIQANLYDNYISTVFAKHNIDRRQMNDGVFGILIMIFKEESDDLPGKMDPSEERTVTITFKNTGPQALNEIPKLKFFNPPQNPNTDTVVDTSYSWGINDVIFPATLQPVAPGENAQFTFRIKAPPGPGVYACDWAIVAKDRPSFVVSKNISVGLIKGDANMDGLINLSDAVTILNYLFGNAEDAQILLETSDLNNDRNINISDGIYLLNYLFRAGPPPL